MVPISPDASPSAEGSIDSLGEPDDEALEPSRERRSRVGLDDEVKVVGLDGEVEGFRPAPGRRPPQVRGRSSS